MSATAPALPRRAAGATAAPPTGCARGRGRPADPAWVRPRCSRRRAGRGAVPLGPDDLAATRTRTTPPPHVPASESWKAWFFGALDPGSFITVDKPPLSLWLMGLSARVLRLLVVQHAAARRRCARSPPSALLYATVRRVFGPAAGPARRARRSRSRRSRSRSARVNNPDALLVLLLVASAWLLVRALESGRTKHLALVRRGRRPRVHDEDAAGLDGRAGAGRRVPARRPAAAARSRVRQLARRGRRDGRRQRRLAARRVAVAAARGRTSAAARTARSWDLILGYNGFGRLIGGEGGPGGGGGGRASAAPPACGGCSTSRSAARSPGCCRSPAVVARRRAVADAPRAADRPAPRRPRALRRLGARPRRRLLQPAGHLPPVLRERAGARGRRARRRRRRRAVALGARARGPASSRSAVAVAGDRLGRRRRCSRRTPDFAPVAAGRDPGRRRRSRSLGSVALRLPGVRGRAVLAVAAVAGGARARRAARPPTASRPPASRLDGNNVLAGPASAGAGFGGGSGGPGGPPSGFGGPGGGRPSGAGRPDRAAADRRHRPVRPGRPAPRARRAARGGPGGASVEREPHPPTSRPTRARRSTSSPRTARMTTAPIIIQTGKAVVTIGGFNGADPAPTVAPARDDGRRRRAEVRAALERRRLRRRPGRRRQLVGAHHLGQAARHRRHRRLDERRDALPGLRLTTMTLAPLLDRPRRRAAALDGLRDGVLVVADGEVLVANGAAHRLTGHAPGRAGRRPRARVGRDGPRPRRGARGRAPRRRRPPPARGDHGRPVPAARRRARDARHRPRPLRRGRPRGRARPRRPTATA